MATLVIDTNLLGVRRPLASNAVQRALDESRRGRLKVALPEMVVQELVNSFIEDTAAIEKDRRDAVTNLSQRGVSLPDGHLTEVDLDTFRAAVEDEIRDLLRAADVRILPFPKIDHAVVVKRALERRQPFDRKGKDGYRDTLIWECLIELTANEPVVFASNDVRAFFGGSIDAGIASHLSDEVAERSPDREAIQLCADLDQAIETTLELSIETAKRLAAIEQQRQEDNAARERLQQLLDDESFHHALEESLDAAVQLADLQPWERSLDLEADLYEAFVDVVEEMGRIEVTSVRRMNDGRALVNLLVPLDLSVEISLHPSSAVLLDELPNVDITDFGFGSPVAKGSARVTVRGEFDARIELEHGAVEAASFYGIESLSS